MANNKIPKVLQNKDLRFCLIKRGHKRPYEAGWQKDNNYSYDHPKLQSHIEAGGNYGIIGGYANLLVVDFDDKELEAKKVPLLPKTFTTRSGSGGLHKYYFTDDPKSWKINNAAKDTLADFQGTGKQVVMPGSLHPNGKLYEVAEDLPIAYISRADLKKIFQDHLVDWDSINPKHNYGANDVRDQVKSRLKVSDMLSHYGCSTSKNPTDCPFHSSKGGKCFGYTDDVWHCFHCDAKGDIFTMYMMKEDVNFPKALDALAAIAGIEAPKTSSSTINSTYGLTEMEQGAIYKLVRSGAREHIELNVLKKSVDSRLFGSRGWEKLNDQTKWQLLQELYESVYDEDAYEFEDNVLDDYFKNETAQLLKHERPHLPHLDEFKKTFDIETEDKDILHIGMYYKFCSLIQKPLGLNYGRYDSDNRFHTLLLGSAGGGKGLIRSYEKSFSKTMGINTPKVCSAMSHAQQLVGKIIRRKGKEPTEKRGFLDRNNLHLDESQDLLNEVKKDTGSTMILLRGAMDSFERNEISKELVDDVDELKYYPQARTSFFMHKVLLNNVFFTRGTYRRFSMVFDLKGTEELTMDTFNLSEETMEDKNQPFHFMSEHTNWEPELKYSTECMRMISELSMCLTQRMLNSPDPRVVSYGNLTKFILPSWLMKFVNILHLAHNMPLTCEKMTAAALLDAELLFIHKLKMYSEYGQLTQASGVWGEVDREDAFCFNWLVQREAFSEETGVKIGDFKKKIMDIRGVNDRMARAHYTRMCEDKFIARKRKGGSKTSLWLLKKPDLVAIKNFDIQRLKIVQKWESGESGNEKGVPPRTDKYCSYMHEPQNFILFINNILYLRYSGEVSVLRGGRNDCHSNHSESKKRSDIDIEEVQTGEWQSNTATLSDTIATLYDYYAKCHLCGEKKMCRIHNHSTKICEECDEPEWQQKTK